MDIVITLPADLIKRIMNGTKKIEVRKLFPQYFTKGINRVFVVQKKTTNVVMSFTVPYYTIYADPNLAWFKFGQEMGIPFKWLQDYAKNDCDLYLWHIDDVQVFDKPLQLEENLGIKRAPQSFCYVRELQ